MACMVHILDIESCIDGRCCDGSKACAEDGMCVVGRRALVELSLHCNATLGGGSNADLSLVFQGFGGKVSRTLLGLIASLPC